MKKLMIIVCAVAITALMGCGKDGETGPQGEQGPAGANGTNGVDGTNGTNGTNGNANVKLFMFGPTTFTSTDDNETYNYPSSVKTNMLDSSLVLYYHKTSSSSAWYATPGLGNGANYQTRAYTFSSTRNFIIEIADADGSASDCRSTIYRDSYRSRHRCHNRETAESRHHHPARRSRHHRKTDWRPYRRQRSVHRAAGPDWQGLHL